MPLGYNKTFRVIFFIFTSFLLLVIGCRSNPSKKEDDINQDSYKSYQLDNMGNLIFSEMQYTDFQQASDCAECHPDHYQEWTDSRHAKSVSNPLFEEFKSKTMAEFGNEGEKFCQQCHDPVKIIAEDKNGDSIQNEFSHGVSCDVCHSMVQLTTGVNTHPSSFVTAEYFLNPGEGIKYGPVENPEPNPYHESVYNPLFIRSEICLPCHNLNIENVETELTFNEWNRIPEFAMSGAFPCQQCHMPIKSNGMHDHGFVGVDVDLIHPAELDPQFEKVTAMLDSAAVLSFEDESGQFPDFINLDALQPIQIPLRIKSLTGHSLPSGTSFNREAWLEFVILAGEDWNDSLFNTGIIQSNQQELNYRDSNLVWFTSFLIDEYGDTTAEVLNTKDVLNYTLPGLSTRQTYFDIPEEAGNYNKFLINARLLFRPVKPHLLQNREDMLENLPVFVIDEIEKIVNIQP